MTNGGLFPSGELAGEGGETPLEDGEHALLLRRAHEREELLCRFGPVGRELRQGGRREDKGRRCEGGQVRRHAHPRDFLQEGRPAARCSFLAHAEMIRQNCCAYVCQHYSRYSDLVETHGFAENWRRLESVDVGISPSLFSHFFLAPLCGHSLYREATCCVNHRRENGHCESSRNPVKSRSESLKSRSNTFVVYYTV